MTDDTPTDRVERTPDDDVLDALAQTAHAVTTVLTRVAAEHDLSLTQLRVLAILRDRRLRMSALADYLGLERSTMSGLVDRAEKRGLLARGPSATDGRAVEVYLTDEGRGLAERGTAQVRAALVPSTTALTPSEQRRLQALLEKLVDAGLH
ncbi:MarR family transcriptional regulator [Luteimicrobium album]|uniref:MarR family transcriptional regulator n=1 Tax=Luteimicrobium album TaxID=1054550 RepID=A0ABQ6I013_9MICO|nr:MarR family transcriptional regulator [Luteimicrobium album]GMA24036.1 MarR family transcriptional regulator [Luteimicrobium album]